MAALADGLTASAAARLWPVTALSERIRAGETLLGTFLDLGSPLAAEIAAGAGFDWLVIDLEHGAGDREATPGPAPRGDGAGARARALARPAS